MEKPCSVSGFRLSGTSWSSVPRRSGALSSPTSAAPRYGTASGTAPCSIAISAEQGEQLLRRVVERCDEVVAAVGGIPRAQGEESVVRDVIQRDAFGVRHHGSFESEHLRAPVFHGGRERILP